MTDMKYIHLTVPAGDAVPVPEDFIAAIQPRTLRVCSVVPPLLTRATAYIEQVWEGWQVCGIADGQMMLEVMLAGAKRPELKVSQLIDMRGDLDYEQLRR